MNKPFTFLLTQRAGCLSLMAACLLSPQLVHAQRCYGEAATITGSGLIVGTPGPDVIVGSSEDDWIYAGAGNDLICAGRGDDQVFGGEDDDRMAGGRGNDLLDGWAGDDSSWGGAGNDWIRGGWGDDRSFGGLGDDWIAGGPGYDLCNGDVGADESSSCEEERNFRLKVRSVRLRSYDGSPLDAVLFVPEGATRKVAWLANPRASGFGGPPNWIGWFLEPYGVTVLTMNTRGDQSSAAAVRTTFEQEVCDLGAGVDYLQSLGYEYVITLGHSGSTPSAAIYPTYASFCPGSRLPKGAHDKRVVGVTNWATTADARESIQFAIFPGRLLEDNSQLAADLVAAGMGRVPTDFPTGFGGALTRTPEAFLSQFGPDTLAVIDREGGKLKVPYAVIHADGDNVTPLRWSARLVVNVREAGVRTRLFRIANRFNDPVNNPGNGSQAHSLLGLEHRSLSLTMEWLRGLIPELNQDAENVRVPAGLPPPRPALASPGPFPPDN